MEKLMVLVLFIINVYACLPEGHPPVEGGGVEVEGEDGDEGNKDIVETIDFAFHNDAKDDEVLIGIDQVESSDTDHNDQQIEGKIDGHEVGVDSLQEDTETDDGKIVEDAPFDATSVDVETLADTQGDIKKMDSNVDTETTGVDTLISIDTTPSVDTIDCPPGYVYDPVEGCVSFCPADKYFESKLGKCAYYPCCDLGGPWEVNVLDPDTMDFTVYSIFMNQAVSYIFGELTLYNPLEISDCYGLLEKKSFSLNCSNAAYKLILTAGTTMETEISGFYSLDSKENGIKNGAFVMTKTL